MRSGVTKLKYFITEHLVFILTLLVFSTYLILKIFSYSPVSHGIYSDQATHIMQSISLAFSKDFQYDLGDLEKYYDQGWNEPPRGIFLNEDNGKYYYSKPFIYSLFSAPFVILLGSIGPLVWNAFCLVGIYIILYLNNLKDNDNLLFKNIILVSFIIFSPYLIWLIVIHPDIHISFLVMAALYLSKIAVQKNDFKYLIASSIFLGIACFEKPPLLVFFATTIMFLFIKKINLRWIFTYVFFALLSFLTPSLVVFFQINELITYQGQRWYFSIPPFIEGFDVKGTLMNTDVFFTADYFKNKLYPGIYNLPLTLKYYMFGSNTGIFIYFPMIWLVLMNALASVKKKDYWRILIIIGILSYVSAYIVFLYYNYYGGAGSFGNRYFLQIYGVVALLFAYSDFDYLKIRKWIAGLVIYPSFVIYLLIAQNNFSSVKTYYNFSENFFLTRQMPIERTLIDQFAELKSRWKIIDKDYSLMIWNAKFEDNHFWSIDSNKTQILITSHEPLIDKEVSFFVNSLVNDNPIFIQVVDENKTVLINGQKKAKKVSIPIKKQVVFFSRDKKIYSTLLIIYSKKYERPSRIGLSTDHRLLGVNVSNVKIGGSQ